MWAGCTSGRRVQGSLPGTVCTALGPLFIFPWEHRMALMGVSFSLWVWVASACTLPSEPDIWPWAGLLVWRGLQERQQAWAQRLCWVLHSRSGPSHSCSQASEIWVLPRGHQGWWGPSVMGSGWRRWQVTALLLCTWWNTLGQTFSLGLWMLAKFAVFTQL